MPIDCCSLCEEPLWQGTFYALDVAQRDLEAKVCAECYEDSLRLDEGSMHQPWPDKGGDENE